MKSSILSENARVTAIVCQESNRQLKIAVHIPAKCKGLDDYSLTTITGGVPDNYRQLSAQGLKIHMRQTVCEQLTVLDSDIVQCDSLLAGPLLQKGKAYHWFFARLLPAAKPKPDSAKIQTLHWYDEFQLLHSLQLMSAERREMVVQALEAACRQGLFGVEVRHKLQKLLRAQMQITISA